ncbi:LacI family DNA-binding transcriptional regulator [Nitrosomonas sp.]|uniref:LacI family DNA-binding transcriptional regulator n=1 Tax=Nitrosomonas sp. TaxID=42353 RepID=UPI001D30300B|nr:LacI family DNA-binding transcriptional regulator [Nitrosomonas sp.]MCB1806532.1 LacI family DNA-binding transcriptional regulator [Candidatus Competibacteraceae bacterium]MCB1950322.1 LacI family DNA-binding transcriptional regulator [Nitrosomonas sp.]
MSIREVAKQAGVSVASVSRVINNSGHVSEKLQQRIQAAIQQLNYIPNSAARALITRQTHIIGALIPSIAHSIYATFIEALQQRLNGAGYSLVIAIAGYDRKYEYEEARQLILAGAEALMLPGEMHNPALYRLLQARNIPYVLNSIFHPDSPHPCVGYDNKGAALRTTNYLLDLGHRRIATITGYCDKIDRFAERVDGIRESLQKRGCELPDSWILQRDFSIAEGREAFRYLMTQPTRPTAIVCGNDVLALGALLEAQRLGVQVPEEVSITGFDDLEWAAQMTPSLTTVHIPLATMGIRVADYLLGRLRGEAVPHATRIEVDLVLRESTGPCR